MGQLRDKRIVQSRIWLDPNVVVLPSYDYDYSYPITVYEAVHRTMEDGSMTLLEEIDSIYRLINDKQDIIEPGTPGRIMTWTGMRGQIGSLEVSRTINSDPALRSHQKIPTERAVGDFMDTRVSQGSFNSHVDDRSIHTSDVERTRWNAMAPLSSLQAHVGNGYMHITETERARWNSKAEGSMVEEHVYNTDNPHNVTAHQIGTYTRREVDEMFNNLRESFFNYVNISWDDRTNQASLTEYHPADWNPNFVLGFNDSLPDVQDPTMIYFAVKPATDYQVDETQDCIIYIKRPGLTWAEVGFQSMSSGDMVIKYPDTTMYVWIQGRFMPLFSENKTGNVVAGDPGTGVANSDMMWRPSMDDEGNLIWTKSTETEAPEPMVIKGADGYTPIKGIDYVDGVNGEGVPPGGRTGELLVKLTDETYDTTWRSLMDILGDMILQGNTLPEGIIGYGSIAEAPILYDELGEHEDGMISQRAATRQMEVLQTNINQINERLDGAQGIDALKQDVYDHHNDFNNPHRITPASIGAVANSTFMEHSNNSNNPHQVTAAQIGLGNVNNTADVDKPISAATQDAIDELKQLIGTITGDVDGINFVNTVEWNKRSATITFTYKDGTEVDVVIPITDVFDSMYFDNHTRELVIILPDGSEKRIDIGDMIQPYTGAISDNVQIVVEGNNVIKATLIPNSITDLELKPSIYLRGSPTTTTQPVSDKSTRIATTEYVRGQVIDSLISYETDRPMSANMGRILNARKVDIDDVVEILNDLEGIAVIDDLNSTSATASLSANMGRHLDLTKAPRVHTSTSGSTYGQATISLFGHARASDEDPLMDGVVFRGTDNGVYARGDHRHPTDTTRAPMHWPDTEHELYVMTGEPRAEMPPDNSNDDRIATTEWIRRNAIGVLSGDCISAGSRPNKIATLRSTFMDPVVFMRQIGSTVAIKFSNADVSGDDTTTLDVNGTGPAPIIFGGDELTNNMLGRNHVHVFVFDGLNWQLVNPVPGSGMGSGQGGLIIGPGRPTTPTTHTCVDEDYDGKCDVCGKDMPTGDGNTHTCIDINHDHYCDVCGKLLTACTDNDGDGICDICGKTIGTGPVRPGEHTHVDNNHDHRCDTCGIIMSVCLDDDNDGVCDICGKPMPGTNPNPEDPDHTCIDNDHDGFCDICGNKTHDCIDTDGDGKCDVCGDAVHDCIDDNDDGKCDICGKDMFGFEDDDDYGSIINRNTGYMGITTPGLDGHVDAHGQVNRVWVAVTYSPRQTDVEVEISKHAHAWAVRVGDGSIVRCRNPRIVETTSSSVIIQLRMETYYPANSPVMFLYHTDKGWLNIKDIDHRHVDNDGDGRCDQCGIVMPGHTHVDHDHDGRCDLCDMIMPGHIHTDEDGDGVCDTCGASIPTHHCVDDDGDGICDICGKEAPECVDNDNDGYCDICGEPMFGFPDDDDYGQIINRLSGHWGITVPGDGPVDTNGQVKRALITLNFSPRNTDVRVSLSKHKNAWAIKAGDGSIIRMRNPVIIETTRSSCVIQFTLESYYPANSPCQFVYHTDNAWLNIEEIY